MALERADTLSTARVSRWHGLVAIVALKLPHSDGSVQTAGNKLSASGRECDRVDAILVARVTASFLESLEEVSTSQLPHSDTFVQTTSSQETVVWRDGDGSHAVLDSEAQYTLVVRNIPNANSAIARTRGDVTTI